MSLEDHKQLDVKVLKRLNELGYINKLHSKLLSKVAAVINESDIESQKPYKAIEFPEDDSNNTYAYWYVLSYLTKNKMTETLSAIQSESGMFDDNAEEEDVEDYSTQYRETIDDWIENGHEYHRDAIAINIEAQRSQIEMHLAKRKGK